MNQLLDFLDSDAKIFLRQKDVNPEQYLQYAYEQVLKESRIVGYFGTTILATVLGGAAYLVSFNESNPSVPLWLKLLFPLIFGGLGLLIGILAIKNLTKDEEARSFITLGVSHKTSLKYMKKISDTKWQKIKK